MKNKLWKIWITAVLILCGGLSLRGDTVRKPDQEKTESLIKADEQELLDDVGPSVVRIEAGKLFGSGIIFAVRQDEIILLTNRHMIEPGEPVVMFQDGKSAQADVIGCSDKYDMGFLRVKFSDLGDYTVDSCRNVRYNETEFGNLGPGDDLFILGSADYPAGNLFYGIIGSPSVYMEDFGTEMLWAYCEVKPGMSGSGVFDQDGCLIGIVCGGNEEKEAAVLPLDKILEEWKAGGY